MSKGYSKKDHRSEIYNQAKNDEIANQLEEYIDVIDKFIILEGKSIESVKKAKKTVKKAIKNLREGHPEKVYNMERYEEYLNGEFNEDDEWENSGYDF